MQGSWLRARLHPVLQMRCILLKTLRQLQPFWQRFPTAEEISYHFW